MICYRDMTFCPFNTDCAAAEGCERALTDEILKAADAWWGEGEGEAPICMFMVAPECFEEKI